MVADWKGGSVMRALSESCANCYNSMIRTMHGKAVVYCGYHYREVALDLCCNEYQKNNK